MKDSQPAQDSVVAESAGVSRREFAQTAAAAATAFMIVPRHVLGQGMTPPSDLVNIATVGIGGMGGNNTQAVMSQNIVAICDCDTTLLNNRLDSWRRTVNPPPAAAGQGRQGGQGGGGRQGGRGGGAGRAGGTGAPRPEWKNFGASKAQLAANEKWTQAGSGVNLKRFVDEQLPRVKTYRDYREMLEKQKDIDAVIVATPDHMHAVIASAAMDLGKHVYVQKPMCWSVHEARHLAKKAADKKVVTQMGNQGHSQDDARRGQEYIMAGAIGDVKEVHVWTNRPLAYWPQGIPRPSAPTSDPATLRWNNSGVTQRLAAAMNGSYPVPDTLSWDLFLGVAPDVEYHPLYHPFNWRGWVDWGQGALGDMGAHLVDHPVWALQLGLPTVIETVVDAVRQHQLPERDDDVLRVPRAARHAGGEDGLVRRRPDAAEARGARRGIAGRRAAASSTSAARARCCRTPTASGRGCCPPSVTTPTARRRRSWRACRTRRTR